MSILVFGQPKVRGNKESVKILFQFSKLEQFSPDQGKLSGIAVPYGEKTADYRLMSFVKGAFKKLQTVPFFVNHESWDVRSMIGATELKDAENAVLFDAKLNLMDDDVTKKIIPLVQMGALAGVSIGAWILGKEDIFDEVTKERTETRITDAEIYELSLVTFQAFESAKIAAQKENNMSDKQDTIETVTLSDENIADVTEVNEIPEGSEVVQEVVIEEQTPAVETPVQESEPVVEEVKPTEEVAPIVEEVQPIVEQASIKVESDEFAALKKELAAKDAEIAKLKSDQIEKDKKDVVKELILSGIVYKSQEERILKSFSDALSIREFYKGVPAAFSTIPKGNNASDVTSVEIETELYKKMSKEVSLSEEDFKKYNKK